MPTREPGGATEGGGEAQRPSAPPRVDDALYRSLFEHAVDGMAFHRIVLDEAGRPVDYVFLDVNAAFEAQTGLARDALLGRRVTEVLPGVERDPADWIGRYGRVALTGEPTRFLQFAQPLLRWYSVSAFSPAPGTFAAVFSDVTEHKRLEQALREADRRKNEFLAVLSHELRNPLAPILNAVAILERIGSQAEQAQRARAVVLRQVHQLARLVDDLLDVTRISSGKLVLRRSALDAREVLRRAVDDHRGLFEQRGIELRLELPGGPAWIDGDPTRLSQVVGNLLHNAAKFTGRGGHAWVTLQAADGQARIGVRDDGIGIAPEFLERIFAPFAQAEPPRGGGREGLGLGLSLVKALVELHGGAVVARSEGPGRGAEVVVTLPLGAPEARSPAPPRPGPARPASVLVVDDDVDSARTLAELLELDGHRVRVAHDGATAVALARAAPPDVILCDLRLPDLDGCEVARALRADPALGATRLVALSGYAQPGDVHRALDAGFDAHLAKPPSFEELSALLAPRG